MGRANDGVGGADDDTGHAAPESETATTCVVACPPHPQHRGHRGDERLEAVADAVTAAGVDCLRIDYGDWDEGYGERTDVSNAVAWARERYDRVGLFGFSFGGTLSLLVAANADDGGGASGNGGDGASGNSDDSASSRDAAPVDAVAALAPTARIDEALDATAAVAALDCPVLVVAGTRDDVADWEPVVEAVERADGAVVSLAADHFFVGQAQKAADRVASWLVPTLTDTAVRR
jgi:alpha/beta superfamily hydrolase